MSNVCGYYWSDRAINIARAINVTANLLILIVGFILIMTLKENTNSDGFTAGIILLIFGIVWAIISMVAFCIRKSREDELYL